MKGLVALLAFTATVLTVLAVLMLAALELLIRLAPLLAVTAIALMAFKVRRPRQPRVRPAATGLPASAGAVIAAQDARAGAPPLAVPYGLPPMLQHRERVYLVSGEQSGMDCRHPDGHLKMAAPQLPPARPIGYRHEHHCRAAYRPRPRRTPKRRP